MSDYPINKRKELTEEVIDSLVELIRELEPGDRIPSEMELAEREGVARGTIREAIRALVSRNVLEIKRGKGTFVADFPGISEDPWGVGFSSNIIVAKDEVLELRTILEPNIAALAAERATDEDIAEIERLCDETEDKIRKDINHSKSDREFHMAISRATHNNILTIIVKQMFTITSFDYIPEMHRDDMREMLDFTISIHRQVLDAITARDPGKASEAMARHLIRMKEDKVVAKIFREAD